MLPDLDESCRDFVRRRVAVSRIVRDCDADFEYVRLCVSDRLVDALGMRDVVAEGVGLEVEVLMLLDGVTESEREMLLEMDCDSVTDAVGVGE